MASANRLLVSTRNFQVAVRFSLPSFASNFEQVANLLYAQANSASYPPCDGKWVVAYGLRGEGLVWLIGAMVCLLAANRRSNCSLTRAMDGRLLRCGIISSYRSAATWDCKALLSNGKKCYSKFWPLPFLPGNLQRANVRISATVVEIKPNFLAARNGDS